MTREFPQGEETCYSEHENTPQYEGSVTTTSTDRGYLFAVLFRIMNHETSVLLGIRLCCSKRCNN